MKAFKNSRISLFNEINLNKNKNQTNSSQNNVTQMTDKNVNSSKTQKKNLNIIEFIKQNKRFIIENSFDVNGTREFLASKEIAMRTIKLNDEILEEKKDESLNIKIPNLNLINGGDNKHKKSKIPKLVNKRTISPRKQRKSKQKISNLKLIPINDNNKTKKNKKSEKKVKKIHAITSKVKSSEIESNSNNDSKNIFYNKDSSGNESNIYKFFIDNANDSQDVFEQKLQKELKKVEKHKKDKEIKTNIKYISKKDLHLKRPNIIYNSEIEPKKREVHSIMHSQINNKCMLDVDFEISSISGEYNSKIDPDPKPKKKARKNCSSIQLNNIKVKENIKEKINKNNEDEKPHNIIDQLEINSDKDSIISILSDLM